MHRSLRGETRARPSVGPSVSFLFFFCLEVRGELEGGEKDEVLSSL